MFISDAFNRYLEDVIVFKSQSSKTEENHYVCMRSLLSFFGDIPIEELSLAMVRRWKVHLDKRATPATVRNYIIKLRVVLKHISLLGYKVLDVDLISVPKRIQHIPDFLTREEVALLIEVAGRPQPGYLRENRLRNTAIVSLLYASGLRNGELCRLDRTSIREDGTFTVVGKGNKPRLCFTDSRALRHLSAYLAVRTDSSPALFVSPKTATRITSGTVQEIFKNLSKKAGLDKSVHPHMMRHSFATDLLQNNTNLRHVQEFLGHESIVTTQMYTHVVNEDLRKIHREKHTI